MSHYKRIYLPNHSYFFTVVTHNRNKLFAIDKNVQLLKAALRYVQLRKPFTIDAICILPDHLHCIWTLQDDCNHSVRWQMIKTQFTRQLRSKNPDRQKSKVWQPRYWEHLIRNQGDLQNHIDYIHYNPVKHGLVTAVKDWSYSSFNNYSKQGFYDSDWGNSEPNLIVGIHHE